MAIKLYKNEQKLQKRPFETVSALSSYPAVEKATVAGRDHETKADLEQKEVSPSAQMIGDLDDWVAVFAENEIFLGGKQKLDHLVQPGYRHL